MKKQKLFTYCNMFFCICICSLTKVSAQDSLQLYDTLSRKIEAFYNHQGEMSNKVAQFMASSSQLLTESEKYRINIEIRNKIVWKNSGIKYIRGQGANLGVCSFDVLNDSLTAYLCNSNSEVVLINNDNQLFSRFSIPFNSRDLYFDDGIFYILGQSELYRYTTFSTPLSTLDVRSYMRFGIEKLFRKNDSTYLRLSGGLNIPVEHDGEKIKINDLPNIDSTINIIDDSSYLLKSSFLSGASRFKVNTKMKIAGLYVIYQDSTNIIIDEQLYEKEAPVEIQRSLVWINLMEGVQMVRQRIPNCYYVKTVRDFIFKGSYVYQLVTAPDGIYMFRLSLSQPGELKTYPSSISNCNYHYNYHLLKENKKAGYEIKNHK